MSLLSNIFSALNLSFSNLEMKRDKNKETETLFWINNITYKEMNPDFKEADSRHVEFYQQNL